MDIEYSFVPELILGLEKSFALESSFALEESFVLGKSIGREFCTGIDCVLEKYLYWNHE